MFRHYPTTPLTEEISALRALSAGKIDNKHVAKTEKATRTITVERGKICFSIPVQNILFIKAEHVYCCIYFINDQQLVQRISLEKLLVRLPEKEFLRVHRSYVVNLKYVLNFTTKKILIAETIIPIGRTIRDRVVARLRCAQ